MPPPQEEKKPMIVKGIKEFLNQRCEPLRRCLWIGNGGGREDLRFVQEGGFDGACGTKEGFVSTPGGGWKMIFVRNVLPQMLHVWIIYLHQVKNGHIQGEM